MACGRQKVKGGNGSNIASISTSINRIDHHPEPRSGLCPELLADFRIPKPPGCSQGAQRAVFCAVRVADFLAEGAGWGASPGRGGEVGVPQTAQKTALWAPASTTCKPHSSRGRGRPELGPSRLRDHGLG